MPNVEARTIHSTYYNANAGIEDALYGFVRSSKPINIRISDFELHAGGAVLSVDKTGTTSFDISPGISIYTGMKLKDINSITVTAVADSFRISSSASFSLNLHAR